MAGPDHPADAFLHEPDFPIEDESNGASAEFQVSQQLGFMDGQDRVNGFYFDYDQVFHKQIKSQVTIKIESFKNQWYLLLMNYFQSSFF